MLGLLLKSVAADFRGDRPNLLEDPVDNFVFSSSSIEFALLSIFKEEECRESSNTVLLSLFFVFSCINLGEVVGRVVLSQSLGSLSILWGKTFAVATPGGVEFN